jgi:hypothetical protein
VILEVPRYKIAANDLPRNSSALPMFPTNIIFGS